MTTQAAALAYRQMDGSRDVRARGLILSAGSTGAFYDAPVLGVLIDPSVGYMLDDRMIGDQTVASRYAEVADSGGGLTLADQAGGAASLATGTTDNHEAYESSVNEVFTFGANHDIWFEVEIAWTATGSAGKESFFFGLSNNAAANFITDAGALAASFDGAGFFKGEDGTHITFVTSDAASQTSANVVAVGAGVSDGSTNRLQFRWDPDGGAVSGQGRFSYWLNGTHVGDEDITRPASELMHLVMGIKTHEGAAKAVGVNRIRAIQAIVPIENAIE